jgi:hypothetical protein
MAITIRAPGGAAPRVVAVAVAPVVAPSKWHARRLEDEVAPEFGGGGGLLELGTGQQGADDIHNTLIRDRTWCGYSGCGGNGGAPYSGRPCSKYYQCNG